MSSTTKLVNLLSMQGASVSQRMRFYVVMAFLLMLSAGVAKANNQDSSTPIINESSLKNPATTEIMSNVDESIAPLQPASVSASASAGSDTQVIINGERYIVPAGENMSKTVESEGTTTQVEINQQQSNTTTIDEEKANLSLHFSVSSKGEAESEVNNRIRIRTRGD